MTSSFQVFVSSFAKPVTVNHGSCQKFSQVPKWGPASKTVTTPAGASVRTDATVHAVHRTHHRDSFPFT